MTEERNKEIENRARIVVRGLTDPESGWYDSPDDLQAVIEGQLAAVWEMRTKRLKRALEIAQEMRGFVRAYGLDDRGPQSEWSRYIQALSTLDAMRDEESTW